MNKYQIFRRFLLLSYNRDVIVIAQAEGQVVYGRLLRYHRVSQVIMQVTLVGTAVLKHTGDTKRSRVVELLQSMDVLIFSGCISVRVHCYVISIVINAPNIFLNFGMNHSGCVAHIRGRTCAIWGLKLANSRDLSFV